MAKWRTIKDFPDYQISDNGEVKSLKHGKEMILSSTNDGRGYLMVSLSILFKSKGAYIYE